MVFANYLRSSWDEGPIRSEYGGLPNFTPFFFPDDAKISEFSKIDSSQDGNKAGFSYVSTSGDISATFYIEVYKDQNIFDNEEDYRNAVPDRQEDAYLYPMRHCAVLCVYTGRSD